MKAAFFRLLGFYALAFAAAAPWLFVLRIITKGI